MSALQGWAFLLLLAGVTARSFDRPRVTPSVFAAVGAAGALAIAQRALIDQVTLDEPIVSPLLLAIPIVAALRGGLRDGLAAALGTWLALTIIAGALPVPVAGELPQETFVLAAVFALLTAGAAAAIRASHRHLAPLLGFAWMAFFHARDASLATCASVWGVVVLTVAWTALGALLWSAREAHT